MKKQIMLAVIAACTILMCSSCATIVAGGNPRVC